MHIQHAAYAAPRTNRDAEYETPAERLAAEVRAAIAASHGDTRAAVLMLLQAAADDAEVAWELFAPYHERAAREAVLGEIRKTERAGRPARKKASAEDAIAHGYNPRRRAEVWSCVGDPLFKHQSARVDKETGLVLRDPGPYRIVYDRAKAAFLERGTTKKHAHDHGMRLATKELLKDLWVMWRQC